MTEVKQTISTGTHEPYESRAFVVMRHGRETRVIDIPADQPVHVGRDPEATVHVDDPHVAETQAELQWDGHRVTLRQVEPPVYLNGKRFEESTELKPGDEIVVGRAQLVVGVATPLLTGGRRALTHEEFRERLYEEIARAGRRGRHTALVMIQARTGEGGHVAGLALDSCRAGDVVATYAHDELELLLPDTPPETARAVVERLLSDAGAHAGLAVAPGDGDNPERLVRSARRALAHSLDKRTMLAMPPPRVVGAVEPTAYDPATRSLVERLDAVAGTDQPVLFTGEPSSGKGVFARLLHERSNRANGPFRVLRCASLLTDEDAVHAFGESESDGAQEGASGGARASGPQAEEPIVHQARGGTLLLDEIGDLLPEGQRRLFAALEREGSQIRVVSTTQRALAGLVERGAFTRELYDRILGERLEVPALRNRPEDIIPLAEGFAEEFGAEHPVRMSPGAVARLRSYPWPGNVLELRNAMERAVRLARGGEILAEHLPAEALPYSPNEGRLREHVDSVERDAIVKALADSNNNQTRAAKRLGISRRALIYKMEKYGLKPPPGATPSGRPGA